MSRCVLLSACVCFGALGLTVAGEEKTAKGTVLESKPGKTVEPASTVNFGKELGLNFPTLTGLGVRVEQARTQADPVGLAFAARDLAVAEKVSGKQAGVTAKDLTKEAVDLAKLRRDPSELRALAEVVGEGEGGKALQAAAAKIQKQLDDASTSKEKGRGIMGSLHVDSRTNTWISVYVDGRFVGSVRPFGDIRLGVYQTAGETTYLSARGSDGRSWSRPVGGKVWDYRWQLNP